MTRHRGLGGQAPAVLASPRKAPGVLAKVGSPTSPEMAAVRAMQAGFGKLKTEHEELRAALGDALDSWEAVAGGGDLARIEALRKRWGLETADPTADRDLTGDTAKS